MKLTEYTTLTEKFLEGTRKITLTIQKYVKDFSKMSKDNSTVEDFITLQKEHSAILSEFINYYAPISAYKENFEFLQAQRKTLKAEIIKLLIHEGSTPTNAERVVYADERYKEGVKDLEQIKTFFIHVSETFEYHLKVFSREVYQTVSVMQKEREYERSNT